MLRVSIIPLSGMNKFNKSGASNWRDHKYHVECDRPQQTLCSRMHQWWREDRQKINRQCRAPHSFCGLSVVSPLDKSSRFTHLILLAVRFFVLLNVLICDDAFNELEKLTCNLLIDLCIWRFLWMSALCSDYL